MPRSLQRRNSSCSSRNGPAKLDDSALAVIGHAGDYATAHPGVVVHVEGFADPTGSRKANALLTDLRAQVVMDQLQADGVPVAHIQGRGRGSVHFALSSQESRRSRDQRRRPLTVLQSLLDPAPVTDPQAVLRRVFGFSGFRGAQEPVIRHVLAGGDALVLMPTGGGKSLLLPGARAVPFGDRGDRFATDRTDGRPGRGAAPGGRGRRRVAFRPRSRGSAQRHARPDRAATWSCSMCRRNGCWAMGCSIGCRDCQSPCLQSTRHIASRNGATSSVRNIASLRVCQSTFPACRASR